MMQRGSASGRVGLVVQRHSLDLPRLGMAVRTGSPELAERVARTDCFEHRVGTAAQKQFLGSLAVTVARRHWFDCLVEKAGQIRSPGQLAAMVGRMRSLEHQVVTAVQRCCLGLLAERVARMLVGQRH